MMIAVTICTFGIAWWLGLYLLSRNPSKMLLRYAGAGLLAYALAIACTTLSAAAQRTAFEPMLSRLGTILVFVPAACWSSTILLMLPEEQPLHAQFERLWRLGLAPISSAALVLTALAGLLDAINGQAPPLIFALSGIVLIPLVISLAVLIAQHSRLRPSRITGILVVATLFFLLGVGLLLFPFAVLPQLWILLAIGVDIELLGLAVAIFDAFDEGEQLQRDMLRSFIGAAAAALLFGGQVALALLTSAQAALPMLVLLFSCVGAAIAAYVLASPLQAFLDRLVFPNAPSLRTTRASLRTAAEVLPRQDDTVRLADLDEAEFARLTRRALSHFGDLPRLANSPLSRLPAVGERLAARGALDQPLERAAELKAMLAESIAKLKPRNGDLFGTSDEWRHYNALYFPYVIGLRPYSRRGSKENLDPVAQTALEWLASEVPERTLYNWQNAAARLIAADLRANFRGQEDENTELRTALTTQPPFPSPRERGRPPQRRG